MTLILVFTSRLEVIDWIIIEIWFLLCIQSGSLNHRYLSISMTFSILLTNTIVIGISFIGPYLNTRKAKSQKPNFWIGYIVYLRFGRLKGSL